MQHSSVVPSHVDIPQVIDVDRALLEPVPDVLLTVPLVSPLVELSPLLLVSPLVELSPTVELSPLLVVSLLAPVPLPVLLPVEPPSWSAATPPSSPAVVSIS
jgi:hypothetical protein